MSFAKRLKRKRGRKFTVVILGEESMEGRFQRKVSVFRMTTALRIKICVEKLFASKNSHRSEKSQETP